MTQVDKNLILSWSNYDQKITSAFRSYLDNELFCNVTLSASGKAIKCHQEILSACSNWFERTLTSIEYHQHPIIILKDVSFKELDYLVNFMYSGEAIVPQEGIQSFLKTAELLEIKGLLEGSEDAKHYKANVNIDQQSKESASSIDEGELTVTTKKQESKEFMNQNNLYNLVIYNQMNMNNPVKSSKSNPILKAYEANNKRKSSDVHQQSNHQETKKSNRHYEANAPVFDNRQIYPVDLVQSHFDYSDDYENDVLDDPPPASGIEDCGPFKKVWSYRYLCYNLGREILCLLCFCRFTQFKKFNLDRHMRNKHPHLYYIDDETKKRILDFYVARYEENVTPGMVASVPSQGNEQMAATLLQISATQLESLLDDNSVVNTGAGQLHPMMEGDELLECQLGDEESLEVNVKKESGHT